jgi:hypothetical protein
MTLLTGGVGVPVRGRNVLNQYPQGVDPARVSAIGMGMCCPVSSYNAANRRVSMVLTGQA